MQISLIYGKSIEIQFLCEDPLGADIANDELNDRDHERDGKLTDQQGAQGFIRERYDLKNRLQTA